MKKPFNRFFNVAYHILGPFVRIWHPTTVEGLENIPQDGGVLFCPNHSSNWDPVLVVLALPVNSRVHVMGKEELFRNHFRAASDDEAFEMLSLSEILEALKEKHGGLLRNISMVKFGNALVASGVERVHTKHGNRYKLVRVNAGE